MKKDILAKLRVRITMKEALSVVLGAVFLFGFFVFSTATILQKEYLASVVLARNSVSFPASATPATEGQRILVKYKDGVSETKKKEVMQKHLLSGKGSVKQIGLEIYEVSEDDTATEVVGRMRAYDRANIEFVEIDEIVPPSVTPNDPSYNSQWDKVRTNTDLAWDITTGNTAVIVGVADTGVDCTHPDLVANCVPGWNFYDNNNDARDVYGHGTPVAGVIAAAGNNALGVAGSAWNVKIMPLRISATDGYGSWSAIASAITYAADRGVKVVNNSYSSSQSASIQSAAQYLSSKGGVLVNSAGNTGADTGATVNSPYIVTVSGTDSNDAKYGWSSFGKDVDVSAPGCTGASTANGGGYRSFCGTSNAAPEVAGTLALIYSMKPAFTATQATNFLFSASRDYAEVGWDAVYGWGRIDAFASVVLARDSQSILDTMAPSSPSAVSATAVESTRIALSWGASTDNIGVVGYQVWRNGTMVGKSTNTTYSDATVSPLTSYSYVVFAYDDAGNTSASSQALSVATPEAPLSLTSNTVLSKTKSSAMISWSTNMASMGVVRYGKSSGAMSLTKSDGETALAHATGLTGLTPKTTYHYQIVVTKPDGTGTTTSPVGTFRTPNR